MNINLVYTINLVLVLNCVIIVAKNETESENKLETKLNQSIYAEGFSHHDNEVDEHKPRIKGRKGVNNSDLTSPVIANETFKSDDESAAHNLSTVSVTPAPVIIHKNSNISSTAFPVSANVTTKLNIDQKTTTAPLNVHLINNSASSLSTNVSTTKVSSKTTTSTTTTTTTTTTTAPKPIKKPKLTLSADDSPEILESEKRINYNVANEKPLEIPRVETDIDRSILDEKRARNSYMIYLGLVFAFPMSFVFINMAYKRVKSYMELRQYQRVDFLVDGMYVS